MSLSMLTPEDLFGPQPPLVMNERLKLEKKLGEYGRTLDVTDLLKKPIIQGVYHFPKSQAFFIDAGELDKAKAIKLGKRVQRHLRGRRTLSYDQPYLHHLDLYVGYDGGTVKLPPAIARSAMGATMNTRQEKEIIRTLVKAGHEPLAKVFARSRGYRVRAGAATDREMFSVMKQLDLGIARLQKKKFEDRDTRLLVEEMDRLSEILLDGMKARGW